MTHRPGCPLLYASDQSSVRLALTRWALQDLDVDMRLALAKGAHGALMRQIEADAALLARMGVMDYSLLLGVHYPKWGDDTWLPPGRPNPVRASPMSSPAIRC